jgi:hypothetical protein
MTSRQGLSLSVGLTNDNQLASASSGKVFPFGPLKSASENTIERLATAPPPAHYALVTARHSVLIWPASFDLNSMTGQSPSWKRHIYYEIVWKNPPERICKWVDATSNFFYPGNGWAGGFMTRQGSTGLVRVEIKQ